MINYPNGKKTFNRNANTYKNMSNQGMALEEMINKTNEYYKAHNIAYVHKRPTPVKVLKTNDYAHIVDGVFLEPSTLDYVGTYKGKYLDFEAKETTSKKGFPIKNIASHQIQAIKDIISNGGISFVIIFLKSFNEIYYLDGKDMISLYENEETIISYDKIKEIGVLIKEGYLAPVDYISVIKKIYL